MRWILCRSFFSCCVVALTGVMVFGNSSLGATLPLSTSLAGRILLQVEAKGEAWYVNPIDGERYFMGRPDDAFSLMRLLGLGITNNDLARIPTSSDAFSLPSDLNRLKGRILLQVELNGEAWYLNPVDGKRSYMGRPTDAFALMRLLGLGITNNDLAQIGIASGSANLPKPGLQIVFKDFGMPDVRYLRPIIKEIQLRNQDQQWVTIWSEAEGKAVHLTPDGAETVLDSVNLPAGTYAGTRLFVSTMDVGVDVNRDGDILDKNVQTILTLEEFNQLPPKEKPSAPTPPAPPAAGGGGGGGGQPSEPSAPTLPYTIVGGYVYMPEFQDEEHTDTINGYIVPQMGSDFVYDGNGGKIIYDFTLHPLLPKGQHISIDVSVIVSPAMVLPATVLLDDLNGATKGKGFGGLTYEDSVPDLGKAADLAKGKYIKYSFSPWYKWDGTHNWNRDEAAPGVLTEGRVEMWVKPRGYSEIATFNWGDAVSVPQSGHILHFGFNAEGRLSYSVWGGNLDQNLLGNTTNIPLNKWTRVAVSWGPDGTKLYVNGKVDASTSANIWPAFNGTTYAYLNYWGQDDLGLVDDFHILKVVEPYKN